MVSRPDLPPRDCPLDHSDCNGHLVGAAFVRGLRRDLHEVAHRPYGRSKREVLATREA